MNNCLHIDKSLATGIGSLPHLNPQEACDLIFEHLRQGIPFWPQLPKRDFKENMYVQFSEGLPGMVVDEGLKKIYLDTDRGDYSKKLESAYEHYLADDPGHFAISEDYAAGFYAFIKRSKEWSGCRYVKGQVIGPISFGLTVSDRDKKAVIYNQEFYDCLLKVLAMKARWQVRILRDCALGKQDTACASGVVIFIDEPYLVSVGSSFFNIGPDEIARMLNEIIEAVHKEGAFAGIHCCGNTDWSIILKSKVDILNFDCYDYQDKLFLYPQELSSFSARGGILAWGIVPTYNDKDMPDIDTLLKKMKKRKGPCLVTPSCGLSSVSPDRALKAIEMAVRVAESLP